VSASVISWPKVARDHLAVANAIARWLAASHGTRVERLVGGAVGVRMGTGTLGDPHAATCELRVGGSTIVVRGASAFVRRFAQQMLGGPEELAAPRPLTHAEAAMWTMLVAAAVEDVGIVGEVWPTTPSVIGTPVVLDMTFAGTPCTIELRVPSVRSAPLAKLPRWADTVVLELPIVVGRCWLSREALALLQRRTVVTLERPCGVAELVVLAGAVGLASTQDPVVARVSTEYVAREMALPDEARVELTVGLGAAKMSLRQVMGLAVGEVVPLGRPMGGPFEVRAAGTLIGQGELVDVDGELGVRIVSFVEEK
jgi:hypothetical protein